ncbi:RHS repeat domain-containing protein, partial [Snodgrassella alvi]
MGKQKAKQTAIGIQRYYDADHRLSEVRIEQTGRSQRYGYVYDALGRRIEKHQIDREGQPYNRTRFLWDGLRMIQETGPNYPTSLYIYTDQNSYEPLARIDKRGNDPERVMYFHTDLNGCPEELTDANGKILWECSFQLWGKRIHEIEHESVEQNLRYQGQYLDRETGLHYNTFRYYDPDIGRFTQPDPIGLAGGLNLYQYAPNGLTWVDPWGLAGDPAEATHITYIGTDAKTGKPYVGYASMPGKQHPEDVLKYRYGNDFSRFGGQMPEIMYDGFGQSGKNTARGLEQRYFEELGRLEGTANKQHPVGLHNANREAYLEAADKHLEGRKSVP